MSELKVHIELTRFVQPEKIEIDANERAVNEKSQYCFFVCTTFDSFLNDLSIIVLKRLKHHSILCKSQWQEECIQKGIATGIQQVIQTGITQGEIIGTLKTYKKFSVSKEETLKNIITDFSLSEEDARNYMEKYW